MSVTTPETPAPIVDAEKTVEGALPAALQPEAAQAAADFNAALAQDAAQAPAAEAEAAKTDPALDAAAKDAADVFSGKAVPLARIASNVSRVTKEVRAGYKTTEFWGSAAVILLAQVGALDLPGKYGKTITTAAAAAAYVVSRGLAKLG